MGRPNTSPVALLAAFSIGMVFCCGRPLAAYARPQSQESLDAPKLNSQVTLRLGTVTTGQIAAELTKQTGLNITAASAIKDRRLDINLTSVTARVALDVIAEMYDWRWYSSEPGKYVLDRRVFRQPADSSAIPVEMQAALPIDFRDFLQLPDLKTKKPDNTSNQAWFKISGVPSEAIERLKTSLGPVFQRQDRLDVQEMSASQRMDLLTWLVLAGIRGTLGLLHDDPEPHKMTPKNIALVIVQDVNLHIETTPDVVPGFGFGAQIQFSDGRWVP